VQFAEAVRGLADGCRALGTPVTGGNVSFYNQTGTSAILPTPVIGVLGVIDDVQHRLRRGFRSDRARIYLLGDTQDEFGGSEWHALHGFLGGRPPAVDFARERALAALLADAANEGLLESAHDLSEGGLAHALVECSLSGDVGAHVEVPAGADPFVFLFSESTGRVVVSVARADEAQFTQLCAERGVPHQHIGEVDLLLAEVEVAGQFRVSLRELRAAWTSPLPNRFES
jgi:phosphoribosylformylglycinamidine (FGAM) synthase-like enzyme